MSLSEDISRISIVGAGTMGSGIAQLFLHENVSVFLIDSMEKALERAKKRIIDQFEMLSHYGLFDRNNIDRVMDNLKTSVEISAIAESDLIIEAVPEKLSLKHEVFRQIETYCRDEAIITTNTSGISINEIVSVLKKPDRALGTHFFMPANIIPLVEVVRSDYTSKETIDKVMHLLQAVGKKPVLINKDIPGFIANRIQHALAREAISLLESGVATAEDIDTVVRYSIGMRLLFTGPLEQRDVNGLDIHHDIAAYLYKELENRQTPVPLLTSKVEKGELGIKTGKGFYEWNESPETILRRKNDQLYKLIYWMKNNI